MDIKTEEYVTKWGSELQGELIAAQHVISGLYAELADARATTHRARVECINLLIERDAAALCALADALGADLDTHWDALLAQVRGLV